MIAKARTQALTALHNLTLLFSKGKFSSFYMGAVK